MAPAAGSDDRGPHLALVGLMGAGKTRVGRLVAQRLGRPFVDVDEVVVRDAGASISELFETEGEEAFRQREADALAECLDAEAPAVVATGGGAVLRADNVERLRRRATVVWLRARPATLHRRVVGGTGRPLLGDGESPADVAARLATLAEARRPAYESAAHAVVDVDERTVEEAADAVLAALDPGA